MKIEKKEERKNEIIGASIHEMYSKGYNGTSVNDIAKAAGIPKGSFYNYFIDKEHYAVDAINYYQSVFIKDKVLLLSQHEVSPLERIRSFFSVCFSSLDENGYKKGCFAGNLSQEMGNISDLISARIRTFYNEIIDLIKANLILAKSNNEIQTDIDPQVLASFIVSSCQGSQLRAKSERNTEVINHFLYILDEILLK